MKLTKEIEKLLRDGHSGREIVSFHTNQIDRYIKGLLPSGSGVNSFAIFATGGYGRRELAPYSDIDIMFFAKSRKNTHDVEACYYKLLDSGLKISHSFRTPEECISEVRKDIRTRTSLLDARFIAGNSDLVYFFREHVFPEIAFKKHKSFFVQRMKDIKNRHKKYGQSIYLLEPNIKESQGGLRDIHEALWLSRVALHLKGMEDFQNILEKEDLRKLEKAYDFLLRLRVALHLLSGRSSDILSHQYQDEVSEMLGIRSSERFHAKERLLRLYYFRAKAIKEITSRVRNIAGSAYIKLPKSYKRIMVKDIFSFSQNRIMVNRYEIMKREPFRILDAYLLYANTGKEFTSFLRDFIRRNLALINERVRKSPEGVSIFIEIFKSQRVYDTLRMMHDDGVLDRFIPEFGTVRFLVINEPYHTYTVDEHTLLSIKALEELRSQKSEVRSQNYEGILSSIFNDFREKEILYLSLLLHDIGKGRGKLHSAEGYKSLKSILDRLMLKQSQKETIEFIVRNHLMMSRFSFHKDTEDPENIALFSESVKNEHLLKALFLVTYADMASVNPEFLSDWKKHLLCDLYHRSLNYIMGIQEDPDQYIATIIGKREGSEKIKDFLKKMPQRYLISSTPEKIVKEYNLLDELNGKGLAFYVDSRKDGRTDMTMLAWDRPGLLSEIVGVLSLRRLNIISVKTFNSIDGYVIDRIQVSNWDDLWWEGMDAMIEGEIKAVISGKKNIKIHKYPYVNKRFKPLIEVDNELSPVHTLFETVTSDRMGLLFEITSVFAKNNQNILLAKINTESDVAHDVFYVSKNDKGLSTEDIYNTTVQLWEILYN